MTSSPRPPAAPPLNASVADLMDALAEMNAGETDPKIRRLVRDTRVLAEEMRSGAFAAAEHAHPFRRDTVPVLPDCAGFTGTGQRCTACRVHRNMHAPTKETS